MDISVMKSQEINEEKDIFRVLDRGIDDMEEKRELPIDEAFEMYKTPGTVKGKILIDSEA